MKPPDENTRSSPAPKKVVPQHFPPVREHIRDPSVPITEATPEVFETVYDGSEKLAALPEWRGLTYLQKKIIIEKFENPFTTPDAISKKVNCRIPTVNAVLHSTAFEAVSNALISATKKVLTVEALHTIGLAMRSTKDDVKLKAALAVLADAGHIKDAPKAPSSPQKVEITWKAAEPLPLPEPDPPPT